MRSGKTVYQLCLPVAVLHFCNKLAIVRFRRSTIAFLLGSLGCENQVVISCFFAYCLNSVLANSLSQFILAGIPIILNIPCILFIIVLIRRLVIVRAKA